MEENSFDGKLGRLIRDAREVRGMSRAKLADITGISVNTLASYEKVGQKGGKMPPANRLAMICIVLELDPRIALVKSLPSTLQMPPEPGVVSNPRAQCVFSEMQMEMFLNRLEDGTRDWLDTHEIVEAQKNLFLMLKDEIGGLILELRAVRQNGSDQDDPNRPENSTNETEAVDPASTRKPGGN